MIAENKVCLDGIVRWIVKPMNIYLQSLMMYIQTYAQTNDRTKKNEEKRLIIHGYIKWFFFSRNAQIIAYYNYSFLYIEVFSEQNVA